MPSLQSIGLFNNKLTGSIPTTIGTLTNLEFLDLEGNMLTGELFFEEMLHVANTLKSLRVSFNFLEGDITSSINNFEQLEDFWAANNRITGSIPPQLCQLKNLSKCQKSYQLLLIFNLVADLIHDIGSLYLYKNNLSGGIPYCIGDLIKMKEMDISSNRQLGGMFPDSIGGMSALNKLHLGNLKLVGPIPSSIGQLHELNSFVVNRNSLTGTLPKEMSKLTNLGESCPKEFVCLLILYQNRLTDLVLSSLCYQLFFNLTTITL